VNVVAFILAVVAGALFLADYLRAKSFIALGLLALDVAWIVQLIFVNASKITVT